MISITEFRDIDSAVKLAILEVFEYLEINAKSYNEILYFALGEYQVNLVGTRLNPHVIDSFMDHYMDESRLEFLVKFLQTYYNFPRNKYFVDDNPIRVHLELMIYSHIWESRPFLKKLFRLAELVQLYDYPWIVQVPDYGKHDFLRNQIREPFLKQGLKLGLIIKKAFSSQLRNAFAHSDYGIDESYGRIDLYNYNPGLAWHVRFVDLYDWSIRFVYSVLLSYHLTNLTNDRRKLLSGILKYKNLAVWQPYNNAKRQRLLFLQYEQIDDGTDRFFWK